MPMFCDPECSPFSAFRQSYCETEEKLFLSLANLVGALSHSCEEKNCARITYEKSQWKIKTFIRQRFLIDGTSLAVLNNESPLICQNRR
jgi:hypothetical protein